MDTVPVGSTQLDGISTPLFGRIEAISRFDVSREDFGRETHGSRMNGDSLGDVERRVLAAIVSELGIPADRVKTIGRDTPLLGNGVGLDSFEALALAMRVEAEFDIVFDDDELTAQLFESLGTIAERVRAKSAG